MKLLIVDDQEEIIRGILSGVDWASLVQVEQVFQALSAGEAKTIFLREKIDLLITDIEMPGESGLELVSWVNQNCPAVKCILLTAHAKFTYAQDAVRLQCVDYILQPVQYAVLQTAIEKAIMLIEKEQEDQAGLHIGHYWNAHRLELEQKTWSDFLSSTQSDPQEFLSQMESQDIRLPQGETYAALIAYSLPAQVQLEELNAQAASKTVIAKLQPYLESFSTYSCAFQHSETRCSFVFITSDQEEEISERMQAFSNLCATSWDFPLSLYVCCTPSLEKLPAKYQEIQDQFSHTLVPKPGLYRWEQEQEDQIGVLPTSRGWCDCFVNKTTQFIWDTIQTCIRRNVEKGTMNRRTLSALQQSFLFSFQQSLEKRGIAFSKVMTDQEMIHCFTLSLHSVADFEKFVNLILEKNRTLSSVSAEDNQDAIGLAKTYIAEHLAVSDLSRHEIAKAAHISESYLSHLFSKETGLSIKDYINNERLKLAKSLLADTSLPISLVAMRSGYNSPSYFGAFFKKATGTTPAEYRRNFQK